jgi:hypothetical protein
LIGKWKQAKKVSPHLTIDREEAAATFGRCDSARPCASPFGRLIVVQIRCPADLSLVRFFVGKEMNKQFNIGNVGTMNPNVGYFGQK